MRTTWIGVLGWLVAGVLPAQTPVPAKEAAEIESAMASGKRLSSAMIEIRRGADQGAKLASKTQWGHVRRASSS